MKLVTVKESITVEEMKLDVKSLDSTASRLSREKLEYLTPVLVICQTNLPMLILLN